MSNESIHWTYDYMYKWYAKMTSEQNNNIIPLIYTSQKVKEKDKNILEPFIHQNIVSITQYPIQDAKLFPNGLYVVRDDNTSKKQWLYFVFPLIKKCEKDVTFADHFTFCVDKTDKKKPCHFHSTIYNCITDENTQYTRYIYSHIKDYFKDEIDIPKKGNVDSIIIKDVHQAYKPALLQLMRKPWNQRDSKSSSSGGDGGAKKKISQRNVATSRRILSAEFTRVWNVCQFKSMQSFGIRNGHGKILWSVSLFRKEREKINQVYTAYSFEIEDSGDSREIELAFQNKFAELAKLYEDVED